LPKARIGDLCECLSKHFPPTTTKEEQDQRAGDYSKGPAIVVKQWERREHDDPRGTADAASYALSHVLDVLGDPKNAAGIEEEGLLEDARRINGSHNCENSDRVGAWARNARIRRISLIGLASGTIGRWQAIYRGMKKADFEGVAIVEPRARAIAHAMKRKQWATVLRLLGALSEEPRLKALRERRENRWGDPVDVTTAYYHPNTGEISAFVRAGEWKIEKKEELGQSVSEGLSVIDSCPRTAQEARPRAGPETAHA
jgi:hypothetical protein